MWPLIAILSCQLDGELEEAQRSTCLASAECVHKYFIGGNRPKALLDDQVWVDVPDDYAGLPLKTQAICRWALDNGYTNIFKADTDTYIHVNRLMRSGFGQHDYTGYYRGTGPSYASGGSGYWLSTTAMEVIAEADMEFDFIDGERGYINGEDVQVGRQLMWSGIKCHWDPRYRLDHEYPSPLNSHITAHPVLNRLKGKAMIEVHKKIMEEFDALRP